MGKAEKKQLTFSVGEHNIYWFTREELELFLEDMKKNKYTIN